jgi:hypothetical protein
MTELTKLYLKHQSYVGNVTTVTIFSYSAGSAQDKVSFRKLWPINCLPKSLADALLRSIQFARLPRRRLRCSLRCKHAELSKKGILSQSLRRDGTEMAKLRFKACEGCSGRFRAEPTPTPLMGSRYESPFQARTEQGRRMGFVNAVYLLPPS